MSVYLGLDSSTQSLTAVVIQVTGDDRSVLYEGSVRFDDDLPEFGTRSGVLPDEDPLVHHSPPGLWAAALDLLLGRLAKSRLPLDRLRAVAGSGQQHGSVYLNETAPSVLARLDPSRPLVDQIGGIFSRSTSPIWMDSSTRQECDEIEATVGGAERLAKLTGSRAFERFTGPQIRKFWKTDRDAYGATRRIHLVSSYMATLLAGHDAAIDPGDGAGMNLMSLASRDWDDACLGAVAPDLAGRLPPVRSSWFVNGGLSPYWVRRHGLPAAARVVSWSGDNPCSLIGVGLVEAGRVAVSLGTSDTLFGFLPEARVGDGHVFGSPTGDYMSLICFQNGSLAREHVRNQYGLDWSGFSQALHRSRPGNGGAIMLPWVEPEITPKVLDPGIRRYGLPAGDAERNIRAVIEAQAMSMANHSDWMGVDFRVIHATGGAAANAEILEIIANVHDADVYRFPVKNSAALGAALRAYHADLVADGQSPAWTEIIRGFAEPLVESRISPDPRHVEIYRELRPIHAACERHALGQGDDPGPRLAAFRAKYAAS